MTKVFAAMHFFENQAKIANDRLERMTLQQDDLLARKESFSVMLDELSKMKGGYPVKADVEKLRQWGRENGVNVDGFIGDDKLQWHNPGDGSQHAAMGTPSESLDQHNNKAFEEAIKAVERDMNRVGDRLSQLNTKTSLVLNDANDGEARVASLVNDYKSHLSELRQKF